MKRLRWLLRVGINPERRHDLRYWWVVGPRLSGAKDDVLPHPEVVRRVVSLIEHLRQRRPT